MKRALFVIALAFAACGEEPQPPPEPKPPSDAWFHLAAGRCFVYKRDPPGLDEFSIFVEGPETSVVAGLALWKTTWRRNGLLDKEEFWEAAPEALLLRRRQTFDQATGADRVRDYDPPPALMLVDAAEGDRRDSSPSVHEHLAGAQGTTRTENWSVTVFAPLPLTAAGESVQATRAVINSALSDGSSTEITAMYFVSQKGLMAYDPPGAAIGLLLLDRVVDSAATCPPP